MVVWLVVDLIAGRGGYKKRKSPELGISAKCHHVHDTGNPILFTLKFSYKRIVLLAR